MYLYDHVSLRVLWHKYDPSILFPQKFLIPYFYTIHILYVEEHDSVTVQACWLLHDNTTPLTWKISSWSQVTSQPTDLISYFPIEA